MLVVSEAPSEYTVIDRSGCGTRFPVGGLPGFTATFFTTGGSGASARGPKISTPFGRIVALVDGAGTSCTPCPSIASGGGGPFAAGADDELQAPRPSNARSLRMAHRRLLRGARLAVRRSGHEDRGGSAHRLCGVRRF